MIDATSSPTSGVTPVGRETNNTQSSGLTSDFNTFLRMLTAQARNQDPLEPLDSSEYSAQLAQFSMVEQQVKTNEALATLVSKLGFSDMSSLSGWIRKEARAVAPAQFDGSPIAVSTVAATGADRAEMVIRNEAGAIVDRRSIPTSAETQSWSGTGANGQQLPHGLYSFSVESYRGEELLQDDSAATYNRVVEARIENGDTILVLDGGQAILSSMVTAVRAG